MIIDDLRHFLSQDVTGKVGMWFERLRGQPLRLPNEAVTSGTATPVVGTTSRLCRSSAMVLWSYGRMVLGIVVSES